MRCQCLFFFLCPNPGQCRTNSPQFISVVLWIYDYYYIHLVGNKHHITTLRYLTGTDISLCDDSGFTLKFGTLVTISHEFSYCMVDFSVIIPIICMFGVYYDLQYISLILVLPHRCLVFWDRHSLPTRCTHIQIGLCIKNLTAILLATHSLPLPNLVLKIYPSAPVNITPETIISVSVVDRCDWLLSSGENLHQFPIYKYISTPYSLLRISEFNTILV